MPVPARTVNAKNIWVAAGDGDLDRVQVWISPNQADENTYTPMHAAASYGHIDILEYLVSRGGDVNITDEDGETPIYTVESVEVAHWLIDHNARLDIRNSEGLRPDEHLAEEFPEVSAYLTTRLSPTSNDATAQATVTVSDSVSPTTTTTSPPSQYAQDQSANVLTSHLMEQVNGVMERAEAEGRDPEEELREVVGTTVLEGILRGVRLGQETSDEQQNSENASHGNGNGFGHGAGDEGGGKRKRTDEAR
ncbi:ankyrin [Sistotremastrum niveocremeum HHB9708]|uniref:Ankyrin n=1 Tax=Sistotremastrum niveocremeum HHB9708 TaxID=1314777 RepID=A0A164TIL4_9AGAM|nr:ankyrin [Sistotremastrum niveocremeum HHB9708]